MDEEFFFPQNVRTEYRLWIFGPKHLRRLALGLVLALLVGWLFHGLSLLLAAILAALMGTLWAGLFCLPVLHDEVTPWDLWREMQHHARGQTQFHYGKGGVTYDLVQRLEG